MSIDAPVNNDVADGLEIDPIKILEALPSPLLTLTAQNRIAFLNSSAELFFGGSFVSLKGVLLSDLLPDDLPLFGMINQARTQGISISDYDLLIETPRIGLKIVNIGVSPIPDSKGAVGVSLFERSIAQRLHHQQQFRGAARSVSGMAAMLAHEVKNPLSGIKGSAQILKSKYSDDFSKKFLKIIEDETDRLNEIVTKILTPAKKPSFAYFNLHETLQRVLALTNAEANDNLNIERDYDPSIPEIYGDKNLFIQAVINIVRNALQACSDFSETPQLGIKTHITYRQPINGNIHATLAEIEISDNGPGIDSELHDQIFFPMVSSKESGSGIGLSIAQDIIRIHGGAISFDRKNNQTIFSILIPIFNNIQKAQSA